MACMLCRTGVALAAMGLAAVAGIALTSGDNATAAPPAPLTPPEATPVTEGPYVLGYTMPLLDGQQQDLSAFKGKVILIVNTASRCGLTGQYEGLQELYENKEAEGFVILGFPANNFLGQEPGTDEQIAEFCKKNFGVSFPMFSKVSVKGDDACPLYRQLTSQPDPIGGDIRWNFDKFLVDRDGKVVARFAPRTKPDDSRLLSKIDELLRQGG